MRQIFGRKFATLFISVLSSVKMYRTLLNSKKGGELLVDPQNHIYTMVNTTSSHNGADPNDPMQGNSRRMAVKLKYEQLKTHCLQFEETANIELYLQEIVSLMKL